jgi:pimeloyl-ACP methyl ester carboxylesterase
MNQHAVALVPGFLGFDHLGNWTYWADRFLAALRAELEAQRGGPIPVVPVPTPPVGSLASRQKALVGNLQALDKAMGGPFVWHLVGHSTGGLDAALLARTNPLAEGPSGSRFSSETWSVDNVRTVTTIAAPHYGTSFALSDVASMTWRHRLTLPGIQKLAMAGVDLVLRPGGLSATRIKFVLGSAFEGSTVQFLDHLLTNDLLARDLAPDVASSLTSTNNRRPGIPIFSIATVTPEPPPSYTTDLLFRDLWNFTGEKSLTASPKPPPLPAIPVTIASDPRAVPSPIGPEANDGVVNTDRQFDGSPAGPGTGGPAGLVLGDHGDVIGLYRRADPLGGKVIEPGLLTSGANFGDNEFFKLIALTARGIAANIP